MSESTFNKDHPQDSFDDEEDAYSDTDLGEGSSELTPERDERKAVYKMSAKDTLNVQLWRVAVTVVLIIVALGVTLTTYKFLKAEEKSNFETAYEKFSRTVGDAAIEQQSKIRNSLSGLAHMVSGIAKTNNMTWPLVTIPLWEIYANDALIQANAEFFSIWPLVTPETMYAFTNYTTDSYQDMIQEGHMLRSGNLDRLNQDPKFYKPFISRVIPGKGYFPDIERDEYWASWQFSPPQATYGITNWNVASVPPMNVAIQALKKLKYETVFSIVTPYRSADVIFTREEHAAMHSKLKNSTPEHPHHFAFHPIHEDPRNPNSQIVALLSSGVALDAAMLDLLPTGVEGIHCIIENNMNQSFSYEIIGHDAIYMGAGDLHETKYDNMERIVDLSPYSNPDYPNTPGNCQYTMRIFPSSRFQASFDSNTPEIFAGVVAITFFLVAIVFFVYDTFVQRRNENLVTKAASSNAIVSSLFPDNIRDRLMQEKETKPANSKRPGGPMRRKSLKVFLNDGLANKNMLMDESNKSQQQQQHKPMADLFLDTTVLFADISGFTAWSSVREPSQVFTLLETLYQAFDRVAKRRRIFKVETVGDCYVAVSGLPEPRQDHAVAMARFARDILSKMNVLTKYLETTLGPDTGDLGLRVGMHSGPVTAGVLRGERARFQLFGDTMNTCARLEASSMKGRILTSKETADLIVKAGKESWVRKHEDVVAKGKGVMEAYWISVSGERANSVASVQSVSARRGSVKYGRVGANKKQRLIDWNVEMLLQILKQIEASRSACQGHMIDDSMAEQAFAETHTPLEEVHESVSELVFGATPLEEVREIIALPEYDDDHAGLSEAEASKVEIPTLVAVQLHLLVSKIADMYNDNPFHNFDHASHVVMSVTKLMSRIVASAHLEEEVDSAAMLHDHTYGITSDPLTQFACAFSALIHDVDHVGVSNAQLVKEGVPIAQKYGQRSVAEQNSLDLSWDLLMDSQFDGLRAFLFPTQKELTRFRQLVVNSVLSTDIVDKDLKALRNARWDKAFKKNGNSGKDDSGTDVHENYRDGVNRKATIVIEHIIQASDISHTMQHWHVYRKWNQNLFEELYVAYLDGRMEKDPADFWYKGEFGFFDFYIIPLTQKLKDCGVFGVSSDEYLNYARKNRAEWEAKGEEVVASMIKECHEKYGVKADLMIEEQAPPVDREMKTVEC